MNRPLRAVPLPAPDEHLRGRWDALPGDPPALTRWLAERREEQTACEPLPPVPDKEPEP